MLNLHEGRKIDSSVLLIFKRTITVKKTAREHRGSMRG